MRVGGALKPLEEFLHDPYLLRLAWQYSLCLIPHFFVEISRSHDGTSLQVFFALEMSKATSLVNYKVPVSDCSIRSHQHISEKHGCWSHNCCVWQQNTDCHCQQEL